LHIGAGLLQQDGRNGRIDATGEAENDPVVSNRVEILRYVRSHKQRILAAAGH
jgi:hypothetical protein